tara:strand:- start:489 stop:1559 length:1071 start_codon:yes stop_codon:yes gene_type:complete
MEKVLSSKINARINLFFYKIRFLLLYIIFGVLSLIIEFTCRNYLITLKVNNNYATLLGILVGILFAFWSNSKLNFKIPSPRLLKALFYFLIISFFSASIQFYISNVLIVGNRNYEVSRIIISSIIFLIAYIFHRKYSFVNFKKVGVAIYADTEENIKDISSKISHYPDFIHIDIVDKTMKQNANDIEIFRFETIKAYWPNTQIQTHIMSENPSKWISKVLPFSDVVYVHGDINQDLNQVIREIRNMGKLVGIALKITSEINNYIKLLQKADYVLLLTIENPGNSGQNFHSSAFKKIEQINNLSFRSQFVLCVDGGVNTSISKLINSECIVSGSSVLKNSNPIKQIMRLQTNNRYEN